MPISPTPAVRNGTRAALLPIIATVFFFSGFSSLIYEVVWMRRLALFFGSDVYSAVFTLSAFMGGLGFGSLLAARYTDRLRRTLVWYGLLEISIGLYAVFFTDFLNLFASQYQHVYRTYFDGAPWLYHAFRILVATVTLLIPTTMMGATLPLIVKHFGRVGEIGRYGGFFYSMNTCGALAGVLGVGFVLLPVLGVNTTTWLACTVNLMIGLSAVGLSRLTTTKDTAPEPQASLDSPGGLTAYRQNYDREIAGAAMIAIALSGLAALALEVVWMRILAQSFGATVYSFSIMLTCFLFGISYGSRWISRRVDRESSGLRLFGLLELGLGVCVALLGVFTHFVPYFFNKLLWHLNGTYRGNFGLASTVAEFLVSAMLIAAPTLLMGATFPVAVKICTPALSAIGRGVGSVYAANTAGGILGALLGGMVFIPAFGTRISLLLIAGIFAGVGVFLLRKHADWLKLREPMAEALLLPLLLLFFLSAGAAFFLRKPVITENYVYGGVWDKAQVIYHGEGIAHNVDVARNLDYNEGPTTTMMVNGTTEANTTYMQRRNFILKSDLPLLLHPDPQNVAVIGLGLGITLSAINRYPDVRRIELIELTREMVAAQRYLEDVSGGVLRSPKIHLRIDDGRNFMAMSDQRFDMVTADPIHPRVTGVGYLYTKEYYESIKRRLLPDGVVCQWMPMYSISKRSFDVAFRTFASVFPNASFWYVRRNGLFVATQKPFQIDFAALKSRMEQPAVKSDMDSIDIRNAHELLAHMLMGPDEISRYLDHAPGGALNTDDNAYLEYHTPFEYLEKTESIVAALLPYAALDFRDIHNISSQDKETLIQSWDRRKAKLLSPDLDLGRGR